MNKFTMVGRVGDDGASSKSIGNNREIVSFTITVDDGYAGRDGARALSTHQISAWGKTGAEVLSSVRAGDLVAVTGRVASRMQTKDDRKWWNTSLSADSVSVLSAASRRQSPSKPVNPSPEPSFGDDDVPF